MLPRSLETWTAPEPMRPASKETAPMGAAAMAYAIWTRFLRHAPTNPAWPDRDRFVLSAGHGSALLYTMLHLTG